MKVIEMVRPARHVRLERTATMVLLASAFLFALGHSVVGQSSNATGTISGSVRADRGTVRAFRVKARDTVNRITYTVFTSRGRYQILRLPPSTYEITVLEPEHESPTETVRLTAGANATADIDLKARGPAAVGGAGILGQSGNQEYVSSESSRAGRDGGPVELVEYDTLYPPGPGRDLLEQHCFGCHGPSGFHRRPRSEAAWTAALRRMWDQDAYLKGPKIAGIGSAPALDHQLTDAQKHTIVRYLATNFPVGAKRRDLKTDTLVRDEEALANAIYIQYELPPVTHAGFSNRGYETARRGIHDVFPGNGPDSRGTIWAAGNDSGSILHIDPRKLDFNARVREWRIPHPENLNVGAHGIIELGGRVYWTELRADAVGELDPKTGDFERYPAPTPGAGGHTLRADSKGNIWFTTVYGRSRLNRIDAKTKKVTEYDPVRGANWYGIVTDAKDRMWAVGYGAFHGIIMYDPSTDKWTRYPTSAANRRVTVDPSGKVWANQYFGNAIASVDPDTGKVTEYKLPLKYGNPYEGWSDLEGNIWIDNSVYNSLVRFSQRTEQFIYVPYPILNGHAPKMEVDSEGTLWFGLGRPSELTAFKITGNAPGSPLTKCCVSQLR
jgi:virginiamycin B lyase